ncbi:MAG: hypothetical protein DRN15_02150 [Thermoprotei archaeon]|nr:MAG: hypothetical protein DRM97_05580 [Thermoprotei archaeon]RLF24759.1 MAG: hypothetical protein DRN15_02150 [Thermoprotei archaeon]
MDSIPHGFIIIIVTILVTRAYTYYLTNMRVIEEKVLLGRMIKETTLDKITDIVFTQGLIGRIFNVGTIYIHTSGQASLV